MKLLKCVLTIACLTVISGCKSTISEHDLHGPQLPKLDCPTAAELMSRRQGYATRDLEAAVARDLRLPPSVSVGHTRHSDGDRQTFVLSVDSPDTIEVSYVAVLASDGKRSFVLPLRAQERVQSWLRKHGLTNG